MKRFIMMSAVLFMSLSTQAAQLQTCLKEVRQCGYVSIVSDRDSAAACKLVEAGRREDGSYYNKKVVFYDSNSLLSIEIPNSFFASCTASRAEFLRGIRETKVVDGRVAVVGNNGHLYMITRTNAVRRIEQSNGQPYFNIVDMQIDQRNDSVRLAYSNGQTKMLSWSEILRKVNSEYESTLVSSPVRLR